LLEDGSWRYAKGDECENRKAGSGKPKTTEVLIGSESYPAGIQDKIIEDDFFEIKAQIVDKNGQALLVLWHESKQKCHGSHYFGKARNSPNNHSRVFLSSGEVIKFIDRGKKGRRTIDDGGKERSLSSFDVGSEPEFRKVDICQEWISYRITTSEIEEIKNSKISQIEIRSGFGASAELFRVTLNNNTLSRQLSSHGF
jgi:hypothetical protein